MTKTLVEQLREMVASPRVHFHYADDVARIAAAASRIEELERALREIVGRGGDYFTGDDHAWCRQRARQALSDKG